MYPILFTYLGFVVAALILGWAVFEISRRYFRQRRVEMRSPNTWVKLEPTFESDVEKPLQDEDADEEEEAAQGANIYIRAKRNGHHSESKKLL
ncbi:MAG TPA: hypothetical protein VED37_06845 [Ktedonobacteraceae bacterium]|nr:hypothetical protein [Ktedonobacteraceae bacterium]